MVKEYEHLKVEDHGEVVICVLTNPPTHTFTSKSLMEVHDFLDQMEKRKDLRVLAFTGEGEDVFIKHYSKLIACLYSSKDTTLPFITFNFCSA